MVAAVGIGLMAGGCSYGRFGAGGYIYHRFHDTQPSIESSAMIDLLKEVSSLGDSIFVDALLYAGLCFYFAWICRRTPLAKPRWGIILMGCALLFISAAMYFVQFHLLQGIDSVFLVRFLAAVAFAFVLGSAMFFIWETISKKTSSLPLLQLATSAEKRKFWIELVIGVVLTVSLILRRKFW